MARFRGLSGALATLITVTACSSSDGDQEPGATGGAGGEAPVVYGEAIFEPPTGEPIEAEPLTWTWVDFPGTQCRDGSPTGIGVSINPESDRVLFYLQGGGACFNSLSCGLTAARFGADDWSAPGLGVFDRTKEDNPFKDDSYVFVPYCTGDVHAGAKLDSDVYAVGPQQFAGWDNMAQFLQRVAPTFPNASQVVLFGSSAGGFGAIANLPQVSAAFGDVPITLLDDSAPPLSADVIPPCLQKQWRETWGFENTLLAVCGHEHCPDPDNYLADATKRLLDTNPDSTFGFIAYRSDQILRFFLGFGKDECMAEIPGLEEAPYQAALDAFAAEADPNRVGTYYMEGTEHVILRYEDMYTTEVSGVALTDWLQSLLDGSPQSVAP